MFFLLGIASAFYLRAKLDQIDEYILMANYNISLASSERATDITLRTKISPINTVQLFNRSNNKVFDLKGNKDDIIAYQPHEGNNQKFLIVLKPDNHFLIVNNNRCLGYDSSRNIFKKDVCNKNSTNFSIYFKAVKDNTSKYLIIKEHPETAFGHLHHQQFYHTHPLCCHNVHSHINNCLGYSYGYYSRSMY